ncbi:MAG: alpha/beta fold hydrolase [Acidimicrobiia bacterium]|nr:alpha/beta fold hydrolase [Acidimicrobiia bacterium]
MSEAKLAESEAKLTESVVTLPTGAEVRVFRGGSGAPLVWLHPASRITAEDPVANALAEHFDVYAPMAPGFHELGELDEVRDAHELAMFYDDLFGVLGLEGVPVAGHSFGGMVAAELAAHYPRRVSRLAVVCPVGLWDDRYPMVDLFATPALKVNDLLWGDPGSELARAAAAASALPEGEEGIALMETEEYIENLVSMVSGFTAVAKFIWPLPDKGLARRLYRATMPSLVIWGAKDRLTPHEYAEDFGRLLPDSRVEVLADAGHLVTLERTAEVVGLIRDFAR